MFYAWEPLVPEQGVPLSTAKQDPKPKGKRTTERGGEEGRKREGGGGQRKGRRGKGRKKEEKRGKRGQGVKGGGRHQPFLAGKAGLYDQRAEGSLALPWSCLQGWGRLKKAVAGLGSSLLCFPAWLMVLRPFPSGQDGAACFLSLKKKCSQNFE